MRNKTTFFWFPVLLLCMIFLTSQAQAQMINVTMRLNTSTNPDTLDPADFVQIRGQATGNISPSVTWDNTSGILLTNIGGDYWEATFQMAPGASLAYKFWTGFNSTTGTVFNTGWEGNLDGGGNNRSFVAGNNDTVVALQYYNGADPMKPQYWRPFESKPDTMAVFFRVYMGAADFDPATQLVDVRGGAPLGTDNPWINIKTLSRETNSVGTGAIWSGVAYVAKSLVIPGTTQQQYKFVIQPEIWEDDNRSFTFSGTNDTTIHWRYYNDRAPSGPKVDANLLFRLKLDALEEAGMFDRSLGDKIGVTGAKGWPLDPLIFDTDPAILKMTYNADLEEWNLVEPFSKYPGEEIKYKYYIAWDTSRVVPESPNYIPGLDLTNGWEEPGATGGADRVYAYTDQVEQIIPGDFGQDQQFFNSLDPRGVIKTPISVTFNIDMAPATDPGSNLNELFRPGIDTAFIQFDGSMVPVTQGLPMYGVTNRLMLDDTDGDGVYSGTWDLVPPTFNQLCYHVVYSSTSGDIENGGGVQSGRRYYQYMHPSAVSGDVISWPATFNLPQLNWMDDSLTVEAPPDFSVSVDGGEFLPEKFSISQNYPNPFNPATSVQYHIPMRSLVKLQVFDITGSLVKVLVNQEMESGTHSLSWNGTDASGKNVASGVYFMRITAGSYTNTIKMMMLK